MPVRRYPTDKLLKSGQDPFLDILDWLGFLLAKEYLVDLLRRVHKMPAQEARSRAKQIIPHVRIAMRYVKQSLDGPADISFLPAYYAILNLMKVYILLGPRHEDLPNHRWHGATYDVHGKDSHSLLTEVITLKKGGVFPLFYETLTSKPLTTKELKIQLKDVLPYVAGVTYEYELATGEPSAICALDFGYVRKERGIYPTSRVVNPPSSGNVTKSQIKLLRDFSGQRKTSNIFLGRRIVDETRQEEETRAQLNTYLIYRYYEEFSFTPFCSKRFELPEELPIALLFFYMSSVVRYRPEFFSRLQDSKFWPLLSSARIHSFYSFLLAFWSHMHRKNYFVDE